MAKDSKSSSSTSKASKSNAKTITAKAKVNTHDAKRSSQSPSSSSHKITKKEEQNKTTTLSLAKISDASSKKLKEAGGKHGIDTSGKSIEEMQKLLVEKITKMGNDNKMKKSIQAMLNMLEGESSNESNSKDKEIKNNTSQESDEDSDDSPLFVTTFANSSSTKQVKSKQNENETVINKKSNDTNEGSGREARANERKVYKSKRKGNDSFLLSGSSNDSDEYPDKHQLVFSDDEDEEEEEEEEAGDAMKKSRGGRKATFSSLHEDAMADKSMTLSESTKKKRKRMSSTTSSSGKSIGSSRSGRRVSSLNESELMKLEEYKEYFKEVDEEPLLVEAEGDLAQIIKTSANKKNKKSDDIEKDNNDEPTVTKSSRKRARWELEIKDDKDEDNESDDIPMSWPSRNNKVSAR